MTNPTHLTPRQAEILDFIIAHTATHGRPPTLREIGAHSGIRSPNGVACHLNALEKKGAIRRDPGSRKLIVVKPAE